MAIVKAFYQEMLRQIRITHPPELDSKHRIHTTASFNVFSKKIRSIFRVPPHPQATPWYNPRYTPAAGEQLFKITLAGAEAKAKN